jgi:multisubunit Na+/H+ antiporter MnhF subunit
MTLWLVAATVLLGSLAPLGWICFRSDPLDGLPALELAGTIVTVLLVLLTIALREGFLIDLALVLAALQLVGALVYVRALERGV